MPQFVETSSLIKAAVLEVRSVTAVENPPEAGMAYLVEVDTPVDGGAGFVSVYVTEERAVELGLIPSSEI